MINVERCGDKQLSVKEAIANINYIRALSGVDHIGLSGAPNNYPLLLAELARDRLWGRFYFQSIFLFVHYKIFIFRKCCN